MAGVVASAGDDPCQGRPRLRDRGCRIRAGEGAPRPPHDRRGWRAPRLRLAQQQGLRLGEPLRRDRPARRIRSAPLELAQAARAVLRQTTAATARSTGEPLPAAPTRLIPMDDDDSDDYDRELELALYREYRDVVGQFKYVIETERRFYLANEVSVVRHDTEHDFYFELTMNDVWVWDIYRADRFVKSVRVLTFKDVNIEELTRRDFQLPEELSLDGN